MNFQQAEQQFHLMDAQYRAGQISLEQYRSGLAQLQVTDASGALWQLQEMTGVWHVLSQGQWLQATPPIQTPIPQNLSPFQAAEQQFQQLEYQFSAGQISPAQYQAALAQLQVTDASGALWQLQEHTGAWYVFWQGQWIPSTPADGRPAADPSQPLAQPHPASAPTPWKALGIGAAALAIMGLFIVGGIALVKSGVFSGSKSQAGTTPKGDLYQFSKESTLQIQAGENSVQDANGTTLQIDPSALPADGSVAQLTSMTTNGKLAQALSGSYNLDTPFYEVSLEGQDDGSGTAELTLPAADPNSRLLVVIDQQYAVLLDAAPVDGKLSTNVHLGPADLSGASANPMLTDSGSIYYSVVTPQVAAAVPGRIVASNHLPQEDSGKECSPVSLKAGTVFQRCRSNSAGTVMVIYPFSSDLTLYDAFAVAQSIEAAMAEYASKGYTAAVLSTSNPMLVVISSSYTSPEYNFKNGVIYLPPDIPKKIASENTAIWHEMAHWIQNKVYSMALAGVSGSRRWWLEVTAEMMVMQLKPEYIASNLSTYGTITTGDGSVLALQSAPYQWPADFYVQAQLVMVNTCDSGCPLTWADLASAINEGTYPLDDSSAQDGISSNMEDYARYLLGSSPLSANSGISLAGVQSQDAYGQIISVTKTTKSELSFTSNGSAPQVQKVAKETGDTLVISAPLEKDGAYPLQISSGRDGKYVGTPLMLVVAPGVPFDYREDGGEVKTSDGSAEVTIGPIHGTLGLTTVRLVAYSKEGGQTFKAELKPIELDGTWVFAPVNMISNSISCVGAKEGEGPTPEGVAQIGASYFNFIGAMGEMTQDSTGLSLDWTLVPSRVPSNIDTSQFTYKSSALITSDGIQLQGELNMPKPNSTLQRLPSPLEPGSLALALILPVAGLTQLKRVKKQRWLALTCLILSMAFILAGCFGLAFYGTFSGDIKITKLEYSGGTSPVNWTYGSPIEGKPLWTFKEGTASYPIDFFIEVSTDDMDGNTTTTIEECTGTAVYSVSGGIYQDMTVTIPSNSN